MKTFLFVSLIWPRTRCVDRQIVFHVFCHYNEINIRDLASLIEDKLTTPRFFSGSILGWLDGGGVRIIRSCQIETNYNVGGSYGSLRGAGIGLDRR